MILPVAKLQPCRNVILLAHLADIKIELRLQCLYNIAFPKLFRHLYLHGLFNDRQNLLDKTLFVFAAEIDLSLLRPEQTGIKRQKIADIIPLRQINVFPVIKDRTVL